MDIAPEATAAFSVLRQELSACLVGVYLHGSSVCDVLHPWSDVDLIAVIDRRLTPMEHIRLSLRLLECSGHYPKDPDAARPLEVVIFNRSDLEDLPFPARAEFVFQECMRKTILTKGPLGTMEDPDLTLLLGQAYRFGLALHGPHPQQLLPPVPPFDVKLAILETLPDLHDMLALNPRNSLLTMARMWLTLRSGEFFSKLAAAAWVTPLLSTEGAAVMTQAKEAYVTGVEPDWRGSWSAVERTAKALYEHIRLG